MTGRTDREILECRDITVRFGDVTALSGVSVSFERGRIHAVLGENGAGKTTFARVVSGLVRPDEGEVALDGHLLAGGDVAQARAAGVELVHQSFALPPSFTVAEAMQFGAPDGAAFTRRGLERRWQAHLDELDIDVRAGARIRDLPVESLQSVEIARALVTNARLLILDEPTAVLSPAGTEQLFQRVRRLKERGVTVMLILHKIREVLAVADTVTVLRAGRLVAGPVEAADVSARSLAELIIGPAAESLDAEDKATLTGTEAPVHRKAAADPSALPTVLRMSEVSTRPDADGPALERVTLELNAGEIVGVAGVEGNGQRTLVRLIAGLAEATHGELALDGRNIMRATLRERRAAGLRVIPFERNLEGLSLSSPLWANWAAGQLVQDRLFAPIRPADLRRRCAAALDDWDVRYSDVGQPAGSLSGGNAQKTILAREVESRARLILAAQPTRGLDIGATSFVWNALRRARDRGCAVLFISSDLDEIMDLSDRVVVMLAGRIVGEFRPPYRLAEIGGAMTGAAA